MPKEIMIEEINKLLKDMPQRNQVKFDNDILRDHRYETG